MIELIAALFVFLALGALAAALLWPAREATGDERMRALGYTSRGPDLDMATQHSLLRSRVSLLSGRVGRFSWAERTARDLRRADVKLRVGEYVLLRALLAVAFAGAALVLVGTGPAGILLAIAGIVVGLWLPVAYVGMQRGRRLARLETQLVEFLPALASSLRSGFALTPAIESIAAQTNTPLRGELSLLLQDVRLGADLPTALAAFGERVGSRDLDVVITAIHVQRTTGGNLPEILDAAAAALRERERIRGEVKTFTAQQRMTGTILAVYPILVGLLLLAIMPSVWSRLFSEQSGQVLLAVALALQMVGFLAIRRAVSVEV